MLAAGVRFKRTRGGTSTADGFTDRSNRSLWQPAYVCRAAAMTDFSEDIMAAVFLFALVILALLVHHGAIAFLSIKKDRQPLKARCEGLLLMKQAGGKSRFATSAFKTGEI